MILNYKKLLEEIKKKKNNDNYKPKNYSFSLKNLNKKEEKKIRE